MSEPRIWHDEADRLATWGTLDPTDGCMCTDCVLASDAPDFDQLARETLYPRAEWVQAWRDSGGQDWQTIAALVEGGYTPAAAVALVCGDG